MILPVIQITNLTRNFGEIKALDNLSHEVQSGEIICFPGPNGAGKTTTVRLPNGIYIPTSGKSIRLDIIGSSSRFATVCKKIKKNANS